MSAPTLSIHVDCDNLFIYETEYGFPSSGLEDLLYEQALPALLEILESHGIRATFFVIGSEVARTSCKSFCRRAIANGHRIANHTFHHRADFSGLSAAEKALEIELAHAALTEACGVAPIGFRAPGYYLDAAVIRTLAANGYRYDASVLPGWSGLIMQAYLARAASLGKKFGRGHYLIASRKPKTLAGRGTQQELVEFPISTFPFLRLPIHTTFVYKLGISYLKAAFAMLRHTGRHHIYLLHAIDALDYPHADGLSAAVVPLQWPYARRKELLHRICTLAEPFRNVLTEDLVADEHRAAYPASRLLADL